MYGCGVELPATGGSGAEIYTVAGLMLITLAGVLMVMRRRRYNRAGKEVLRESLIRLSLFLELSALAI